MQARTEQPTRKKLKEQSIATELPKPTRFSSEEKSKQEIDPGRSRNPTLAQKSRFGDVFLTIGVAVGAVALRIGPEASPSQGEANFDASRAAQK